MSDLVRSPEDRFSRVEAHLVFGIQTGLSPSQISQISCYTNGSEIESRGPGSRPRGYKTFFMLSSAETKIYPAHKC